MDREKAEEISLAENPETAEKIENDQIASEERKHYNNMLQHVQNQGMESMSLINFSFWKPAFAFLSLKLLFTSKGGGVGGLAFTPLDPDAPVSIPGINKN